MINQEELKILLLKNEITQLELAQELGVSRKTINNWLGGKSKMRLSCDNIIKIYALVYQNDDAIKSETARGK
jgi:transcriptional regulator with XRE-family HTH domain